MSQSSTVVRPTTAVELSDFGQPNQGGADLFDTRGHALNTDPDNAVDNEQAPSHATEAIPDGGYGWAIVAAGFSLTFWTNGYTTAWGVLQTAILRSSQLQTDIRTITFVGSLYMSCIVALSLVSVRLMNLYGARYSCLAASILFGLGLVALSFTLDHLAGLFCLAGLTGCASSLLFTASNTLPIQWFSSKLGTANGLVKTGGGVGATVLPIAAQGLIDRVGLQWTVRIIGFLVLVTGIPSALLLRERNRTGAAASRLDWSLFKDIPFMTSTMGGAVGVFAAYVPPFFLPLFASSIGLSASTGAGLVAGFGASTAVGRLVGGWVCDRIGAFNSLALSALLNSISMLAIWPVSDSLPPLFIFAIVNGCANGSFFVALPTAVAALTPGSAATSISLMSSFWTPGYFLGAPLAGILIDATGAAEASSIGPYRAAIFYAAGVGVLTTIFIAIARLKLNSKLFKKL